MKKYVFFITLLSALVLACSSNSNSNSKSEEDSLLPDSIIDTTASDFKDMLGYFSRNADSIPDKYCYEFLRIKKNELYSSVYVEKGDSFETEVVKNKVLPTLMKEANRYVLLVYSETLNDGDPEGPDTFYYLKTFTPMGNFVDSIESIIAKKEAGDDVIEPLTIWDYCFKDDSTLYLLTISPASQDVDEEDFGNDSTSKVEMVKYSILSNGHLNKLGQQTTIVKQGFNGSNRNSEPLNHLLNLSRSERDEKYVKWIEDAESGN